MGCGALFRIGRRWQAYRRSASDKLRVGLIGAGGMGRGNLEPAQSRGCGGYGRLRRVEGASRLRRAQYPTAKPYADFRELLQQPDVDGVIIATPPHWHCLIAVAACEAGKDLYIQKPMTLYVAETLAIKRAVAQHGRISQVGMQIHAGENYRRVVERVRSGQLGPISVVRTFNVMNQGVKGLGFRRPVIRQWISIGTCGSDRLRIVPTTRSSRVTRTRTVPSWHSVAVGRPAWRRTSSTCRSGHWNWERRCGPAAWGATGHPRCGRRARHAGSDLGISDDDHALVDERRQQFWI